MEKSYCISDARLDSRFFGDEHNTTSPMIIEIPEGRARFSVPSSTLISRFVEHNLTVIDSTNGGVVLFLRHCDVMGKLEVLQDAFMQAFIEHNPLARIDEAPLIYLKSSLPEHFEHYQLQSISLSPTMARKTQGSFIATFRLAQSLKRITFYYELGASMQVFKAKRNMQSGTILTHNDVHEEWLSIDAVPTRALTDPLPPQSVLKSHLKEGQIITQTQLKVKKELLKNETIKARLEEGAMVIELHVTLLEDANRGDTIKVKSDQGKVLQAKILSHNEAIILP